MDFESPLLEMESNSDDLYLLMENYVSGRKYTSDDKKQVKTPSFSLNKHRLNFVCVYVYPMKLKKMFSHNAS